MKGNECTDATTRRDTPSSTSASDSTSGQAVITTVRDSALYRSRMAIEKLAGPGATAEDFLTVRHTLAALREAVREYAALADEASLAFLQEHGSVETESERYYAGKSKTTKCRDTKAAVVAILNATGGDFDRLVGAMASQPLKHGACRGILGDEWDRHFEVTEKDTVEVKRVDPRMLPGKEGR